MSRRLRGCRHAWVDVSISGTVAAHTLGVLRGAASPHFTATVLCGDQPIGMRRSSSFVLLALGKSNRSAMTPSLAREVLESLMANVKASPVDPLRETFKLSALPSDDLCVLFEFPVSQPLTVSALKLTPPRPHWLVSGLTPTEKVPTMSRSAYFRFGRVVESCVVLSVLASCGKQTAASSRRLFRTEFD